MPPIKWSRSCVICKTRYSRSDDGKRKFMTKFPLEYNRCREWVRAIGIASLASMPVEKLHELKYLCGDHFEDKYYNKKKTRLTKSAVPTLSIKAKPLTEAILAHFPKESTSSTKISSTSTNISSTKMKEEVQVCGGCLSMGRRCCVTNISFMKQFIDLPQTDDNDAYIILLCWECRAMVRKILAFQQRVQVAGRALQQNTDTNFVKQSTLVVAHKDTCDLIINENDNENGNDDKVMIKIENVNDDDEIYHDDDIFNEQSNEFNVKSDEFNDKSAVEIAVVVNDNTDVFNDKTNELNDKTDELNHKTNEFNDNCYVSRDPSDVNKDKRIKRKKKKYVMKRCKNYTIYKVDQKKIKSYVIEKPIFSEALDINYKDEREIYKYKCAVCSTESYTRVEYQNHMAEHNAQIEANNFNNHFPKEDIKLHAKRKVLYKCNLCKSDSTTMRMFELHFREHKTLYKCNHCKVQFDTEAAVCDHYSELHSKCICDNCGVQYGTKGRLIQHIDKSHKKHECDICKRNFTSRDHLGRHKANIHGIYKWRQQPTPEEMYCVECDKHFASRHALKKHLYSSIKHGGYKQKSVACTECGKVLARMSYMKNHYRLFHSEENKYRCDLCGKRLVSGFALKQHRQLVHEKLQKPKDKICDACGRGFASNRTLIQHIRTHTGERPFPCSLCPATFSQKYSAQIHFRSQHANKNLVHR